MVNPIARIWREMRETRRKISWSLDVSETGFRLFRDGHEYSAKWDAITAIEAGTKALMSGNAFYVVLHEGAQSVTIEEFATIDFAFLEKEIFKRWPGVRQQWTALQIAPEPDDRKIVLWTRP